MKYSSPYRRGVIADMTRGFQGPNRGIMVLVFAAILVALALSVVSLVALLAADDTRSQILLGVFFLASWFALGLLKTAYYQRLDRLAVLDALEELRERVGG